MIHHQRPLAPGAVGIGEHVFIDVAFGGEKIVQQEILHTGKQVAAMQQGKDLPLVTLNQPLVWLLVPVGAAVFHAVFLGEALDLAVAEHG